MTARKLIDLGGQMGGVFGRAGTGRRVMMDAMDMAVRGQARMMHHPTMGPAMRRAGQAIGNMSEQQWMVAGGVMGGMIGLAGLRGRRRDR